MSKKIQKVTVKEEDIKLVLNPESKHAYFANYFSVEVANDDVTFGFGQKVPGLNDGDLPTHEIKERIVLTKKGAEIFYDLLSSIISEKSK
jgi:hypothetical protein